MYKMVRWGISYPYLAASAWILAGFPAFPVTVS